MFSFSKSRFPSRYEDVLITLLRVVIAIIFVWFGVLKIFGYNPVFDLVYNSMAPFLAKSNGLIVLGVVETFIGVMLLLNRARFFTHMLLVLHLLGTFSTFIYGWDIIFQPHFPILSLGGEFVVKNIIIVMAGLVVLVHQARRR